MRASYIKLNNRKYLNPTASTTAIIIGNTTTVKAKGIMAISWNFEITFGNI